MSTQSAGKQNQYPIHKLQHYQQTYNWDCGVSCVLMLLSPVQREEFLNNFQAICQEEGFGQSTWTIDLCYLLKRFGIKHCMYTTFLGVNEDYKRLGYYNKIIDKDRDRVRRRFAEAASAGIEVREGSVSMEQLAAHLDGRGPAVLLLDGGLLACSWCGHNRLGAALRRCWGGSYSGHYVVAVGRRGGGGGGGGGGRVGQVVYRDPRRSRLCAAAAPALLAARRAPGTDEDVILIYNSYT